MKLFHRTVIHIIFDRENNRLTQSMDCRFVSDLSIEYDKANKN